MRKKYSDFQMKARSVRDVRGDRDDRNAAFTLMELLIVIIIIAILAAFLFPALQGVITSARATTATYALRDMVNGTINWSVDHGGKIPSPQYTDVEPENVEEYIPTGTGLWCDGVVFKNLYPETDPATPGISRATAGGHLMGTVFESIASVKANTSELDWYRHSYGMNKNLVYDEINASEGDPWLTEKTLANIEFLSSAMIFLDSPDSNVVDKEMMSLEALEKAALRYRGKYLLVCFMDGHVERMNPNMIPQGDINSDREASRFWRGVDP